jgi:hypothetical protein
MGVEPILIIPPGFAAFDRRLKKETRTVPDRIEKLIRGFHFKHRKAVIQRSDFSPEGKRRLRFIVRVFPRAPKRPKKIEGIEAGTGSWWRGADVDRVEEGAAARTEKKIGKPTFRATKKRFLLIPWGDFLTKTGRPRRARRDIGGRTVQAPILIRDLPGTRIIKGKDGKLRVIQRLAAGQRGKFETGAKGTRSKGLGSRERIVGILVRQARSKQGLDFFGSWDSLADDRDRMSDEMLDRLAADMAR